jgi:hypothetical protein
MATATAFDPKTALITQLNDVCKSYITDLSFVPKDKLGASPMGKARTALEFTAECAGFNKYVAKLVAGEIVEPRTEEQVIEYRASLDTFEKVSEELKSSVTALTTALSNATGDHLHTSTTTPWGMEATIYRLASMASSHMIYHDGQLNYIQSLYGDDQNHWSD